MKINYCRNCGSKISKETKFCGNCGEKINEQETATNICSECGYVAEKDEKFCPECGSRITSSFNNDTLYNDNSPPIQAQEGKGSSGTSRKQAFEHTTESETKMRTRPQTRYEAPKQKKKGFFGRLIKWVITLVLLIAGLAVLSIVLEDTDLFNDSSKYTQETSNLLDAYERNKDALSTKDISSADKYRYGIDVIPDQYEAIERYKVLAEKGDLNAMISLSEYYEQGIWVERDRRKAITLLEQAAAEGSIEAKWQLEYLKSVSR